MKFSIFKLNENLHHISDDQFGLIGRFRRIDNSWKFHYIGTKWMKMTYAQNTALLEFIREPLVLLNITARLLK